MATTSSLKDEIHTESKFKIDSLVIYIDFYVYLATHNNTDICSLILIGLSYFLMVITFPISLCLCIRVCFSW